jgi:hypothetical protein
MRTVELAIRPDTRGYTKVKGGAKYGGVSVRTFRGWLTAGLPHFRLSSGTILVAYSDIDAWLERFRADGSKVDKIVDQVMSEL